MDRDEKKWAEIGAPLLEMPADDAGSAEPEDTGEIGYVVAVGNPFDGLTMYGDPEGGVWEDANDAAEFASEEFRKDVWHIVTIHKPE